MDILRFFLLCVFIISPFVDMYNGYVQQFLNSQTVLPVVFKMAIILFSFRYILLSNKVTIILRICFVLFLLCVLYWESSFYIDNWIDLLRYASKLIYPYCILVVLYAFKSRLNKDILLHYALAYGVICSASILLSDLLGITTYSYSEDYGYGIKGLFNAGNDIGLSLVLCNCISAYYVCKKDGLNYVLFNIVLLVVCFRLGSVASIAAASISVFCLIFQSLFIKDEYSLCYYRYRNILFLIGVPIIVYSIYHIVNADSYTIEKFDIMRLTSGGARRGLEDAFYTIYANFTIVDKIFGISPNELFLRVARYFSLYGVRRALEVDHLELIGAYGFLLGGILLLYPICCLLRSMRIFFERKDVFSFWMTIAFFIFVFHGILAGHAFTSVSAMTILVVFMFIGL